VIISDLGLLSITFLKSSITTGEKTAAIIDSEISCIDLII